MKPVGRCWVPPYCRLLRSAGATEGLFVTRELYQEPPTPDHGVKIWVVKIRITSSFTCLFIHKGFLRRDPLLNRNYMQVLYSINLRQKTQVMGDIKRSLVIV